MPPRENIASRAPGRPAWPGGSPGGPLRPGEPPRAGSLHAFEPGKLVAGLVLLTAGVVALLDSAGALDPGPLLLPAVLLGLGAAGVVGAVARGVHRRRAGGASRG